MEDAVDGGGVSDSYLQTFGNNQEKNSSVKAVAIILFQILYQFTTMKQFSGLLSFHPSGCVNFNTTPTISFSVVNRNSPPYYLL
jgi:hypothetical protein